MSVQQECWTRVKVSIKSAGEQNMKQEVFVVLPKTTA